MDSWYIKHNKYGLKLDLAISIISLHSKRHQIHTQQQATSPYFLVLEGDHEFSCYAANPCLYYVYQVSFSCLLRLQFYDEYHNELDHSLL